MSDAWRVEPHDIIPELEPDYQARGFTIAQHIDPQLAAQLRQLAAINTMADLDLEADDQCESISFTTRPTTSFPKRVAKK